MTKFGVQNPRLIALALIAVLAGCAAAQTGTTTATTLSAAQSVLAEAMYFYGIAKGIAQVAVQADPALGSTITPTLTALDALFATAQAALADAQTTAPTIEALATQLKSQSTSLVATAAPAVKVVSNH